MKIPTRTLSEDLKEGGYGGHLYICSRFPKGKRAYSVAALRSLRSGSEVMAVITRYDDEGAVVEEGVLSTFDWLLDNERAPHILVEKILTQRGEFSEE